MPTRIAVIGAGLIGRKHIGILHDDSAFELAGIGDPAPQAEAYARENGYAYFKDTETLLDKAKPDGVVTAHWCGHCGGRWSACPAPTRMTRDTGD